MLYSFLNNSIKITGIYLIFKKQNSVLLRTGCPEKWLSRHPWRYLKDVCMWQLGTWFSGGLGSVRLMIGPDDLKGLFQPKLFYDWVELFS